MVESSWASRGLVLHPFDPGIRRLECLHFKILKRKHSAVYNQTCLNNDLLSKYKIHTHTHTHIYIYIRGAYDKFPDFFPMGIWNCRRLLKVHYLIACILWDDWPIFMISGSNEQLQQQLEYTPLKTDCHSWWSSKMQSDTLEEWYAIKILF